MLYAEGSIGARKALLNGDNHLLRIEHVLPQRAFAKQIINLVYLGTTDEEVLAYQGRNYERFAICILPRAGFDKLFIPMLPEKSYFPFLLAHFHIAQHWH